MTSLSERLSVVRPQWETQLDAFHALSTRALDSAEQLFALNLKTSRASMEHASGTLHQMLHVTDPRELFAIGTQAQGQWQNVFSYSRELLGIAMGARQRGWTTLTQSAPLLPAPLPNPVSHIIEQAGIAIAGATTVNSEIVAAAVDSNTALAEATLHAAEQSASQAAGDAIAAAKTAAQPAPPQDAPSELDAEKTGEAPSEIPDSESAVKPPPAPETKAAAEAAPVVLAAEETSAHADAPAASVSADEILPAKAKPLVEAMNEIAAKPAGAEHPLASTLPLAAEGHIELPLVTPADATPPVQLSNGPAPAERRRSSRKKS